MNNYTVLANQTMPVIDQTIPSNNFLSTANVNYTGAANVGTNYSFTSAVFNSSACEIRGDLKVSGSLNIEGSSLNDRLTAIEERLSILIPDPKKLEKYEALRKAYESYKIIEAMCNDDK